MSIIFPPALAAGQTIGIFAPSSSIIPERFEIGVRTLEERGYKLIIHPQTYTGSGTGNQQAGTPEAKAAAFMDLWTNPMVNAVFAACGGNGAVHMLPLLDWDIIKKTPKTLMGFSDTTALLSALYAKTDISGIFGPTVQTLDRIADINLVFRVIEEKQIDLVPLIRSTTIKKGVVDAPAFAGTLSVLLALAGTKFFPSLEGHILIIEDIGEELSHLDRMLWQLRQLVDFTKLAGFACGDFTDLKDTGRPFGPDFHDIISTHTAGISGPVMTGLPVTHGNRLLPIGLGKTIHIDSTDPHTPHLILR